jgi:hypothetical protein
MCIWDSGGSRSGCYGRGGRPGRRGRGRGVRSGRRSGPGRKRSCGAPPGPSGGGPARPCCWKACSSSSRSVAKIPARVPNRRNSVPLPRPAFGQPVHGQRVRALLGGHVAGGGQQVPPVSRGVGGLGVRLELGKCRDFPVAWPALHVKTQGRSPQVLACPGDRARPGRTYSLVWPARPVSAWARVSTVDRPGGRARVSSARFGGQVRRRTS